MASEVVFHFCDDCGSQVRDEDGHTARECVRTLRAMATDLARERDQARERESYALAAIERNDERHAEALRAVRQRAERAEQTRDAHAEALARAAREAGDAQDQIAALTVERDEARDGASKQLSDAVRFDEACLRMLGAKDESVLDAIARVVKERDEARATLIRSQEDHRAAVEALETYEERIGDIADHVLGLVPPDVPSIVKLDAIERRCGEERVAARQAEARVRELEARLPVDGSHMPSIVDLLEDEVATLRAIADAAAALTSAADACDREAERHPSSRSSAPMVRYIGAMQRLRAALAARGKDGAS